jgi:hypothetical protein
MHPVVSHTKDWTVYIIIIPKQAKIDTTGSTFVSLVVGDNATYFDPLFGSSSGVQEYWY